MVLKTKVWSNINSRWTENEDRYVQVYEEQTERKASIFPKRILIPSESCYILINGPLILRPDQNLGREKKI